VTRRWQWATVGAIVAVAALAGIWRVTASRGGCDAAQGKPARLDFALKDMEGRDVNLASFKGRPVLLNFWATWCGPCKEEIPALIELASKYRDDLVVLGISIDDKPDELKKFAAEYKMNYPVLVGLGQDELLTAYEADAAVPISWFITPCATVSAKHPGIASKDYFEQQLQALF
jgi:cytochrome c biogenesis protein CcmG, thiol:disulfide interchange protein DsbE